MKRFRAARACDSCRQRKTRCDAREPCGPCVSLHIPCLYGTESISRGKSEMILDTVIRMEAAIDELKSMIALNNGGEPQRRNETGESSMSPMSATEPTAQDICHYTSGRTSKDLTESAILSSGHLSSTETLLKWPVSLHHPSIQEEASTSFLSLEYRRAPFRNVRYAIFPSVSASEVKAIVSVFQQTYNFWFPMMNLENLQSLQLKLLHEDLEPSPQSCLALLVMALGSVGISVTDDSISANESQGFKQRGAAWFDAAVKMLHLVHLEMSVDSCRCLLLTGLYFSFLQRPLQTWSHVNEAATRCRLVLSCSLDNPKRDDREIISRIFWSCFVLESNYISEIPSLPQNCSAGREPIISLPGRFCSHERPEDSEKSTLYLLASIALRRLLNRAHYMMYDREIGLQIHSSNFPSVNQELAHQLEDWHQTLPPSLQFAEYGKPTDCPYSEYLRQWYLSCRSVIYRPYLEWALANPLWDLNNDPRVLNGCRIALDTCFFKLQCLKPVSYTLMVDTWPCSLSIATAVLTLMGGFCHPQLMTHLRQTPLIELGPHLHVYLQQWILIHSSSPSPGVEKSLRLIMKAHAFFESRSADFVP